jgi:hypothetical protein
MNPSSNPDKPRRLAAPNGNLNALKHGLYASRASSIPIHPSTAASPKPPCPTLPTNQLIPIEYF